MLTMNDMDVVIGKARALLLLLKSELPQSTSSYMLASMTEIKIGHTQSRLVG